MNQRLSSLQLLRHALLNSNRPFIPEGLRSTRLGILFVLVDNFQLMVTVLLS